MSKGAPRMAVQRRRRGGIPPTWTHPLQTKATIVGKNEIYNRDNFVGPFLIHKLLGLRPTHAPLQYFPGSPPPIPRTGGRKGCACSAGAVRTVRSPLHSAQAPLPASLEDAKTAAPKGTRRGGGGVDCADRRGTWFRSTPGFPGGSPGVHQLLSLTGQILSVERDTPSVAGCCQVKGCK